MKGQISLPDNPEPTWNTQLWISIKEDDIETKPNHILTYLCFALGRGTDYHDLAGKKHKYTHLYDF